MSTAFRSVAPFLRTVRHGLKTGRVDTAIRSQNAAGVLNLYRTYAVYERTKTARQYRYATSPACLGIVSEC